MINLNTKTGRLRNSLANRILSGEYKKGEKLPSVRQLAEMYNASTMTAKLAITELRNIGLVDTKQGSGTYVIYDAEGPPQKEKHLNIGLAYLEYYKQYYVNAPHVSHPALVQWLAGMHDYFDPHRASVIPLSYPKKKLKEPESPVRIAIETKRIDGIIITGWLTAEEADYLTENKIPFVLVDHYLPEREVATVNRNFIHAFRLLMTHLLELHHKKILYFAYSTNPEIYRKGVQVYVRLAKSLGYADFSSKDVIVISNDDPSQGINYSEYITSAIEKAPDAIIVDDEIIANKVFYECIKNQINIPEDLSLASIVDAKPDWHIMRLTTTDMLLAQREAVRIASDLLERALKGEDISNKHILLLPTLIVGESTRLYREMSELL